MARRIIISAGLILFTLGLIIILWQFRLALALFAFSLGMAAALRPVVDFLSGKGVRRGLAILITYLLFLGAIAGLLALLIPALLFELEAASNNFTATYEALFVSWPSGTPFQQAVAARLPAPADLYQAIAGEQGQALARTVLGFAQSVFSILGFFSIVLVLSIYWSADRVRFERLWLSILPAQQRARAREIWRSIEAGVGAYLRSELIQSVLAGLLLWLGYTLLGLPYPVLLAVIAAVLWLIPWLGAVLAIVPAVLSALAGGPLLAVGAGLFTLVVLLVLEFVVEPRIFWRDRYSSLLVAIVLVALADVFGLVGLVVAPPLAAAIQIFFQGAARFSAPPETVNPQVQLAALQTRLEKIKSEIGPGGEISPETRSMIGRLEQLLNESIQRIGDEPAPSLGLPVNANARLR